MTTFKPIYRAEIRASRSEVVGTSANAAEMALLMPPAGPPAPPHRDWFRVATAQVGYGFELEGEVASYVSRSVVSNFPTGNMSVEMWIRIDNALRSAGIVSYAVSGDFNNLLIYHTGGLSPGNITFTCSGGWGGGTFTNTAIVDGKWHHLVWTRTSGGTGISYLDGVQQVSSSGSATAVTTGGYLFVGQEQDALGGGLDANQALDGAVDGFKVYSRVLSAQEVAERFRGIVSDDTSKVLHWDFDEGFGFTTADLSGNGNEATLLNGKHIGETPTTWKPYLGPLRGRRGRIDLDGRSLDVGALTLTLADKRVPDPATGLSNLKRWWAAFFGDVKGKPRGKLKCIVEESLDGGATFSTFATARIVGSNTDRKASVSLTIHDEAEDLKMDAFIGPPHPSISYAAMPTLLPLGVVGSDYGTLPQSPPITGTITSYTVQGLPYQSGVIAVVGLGADQITRPDNLLTKGLVDSIAPNDVIGGRIPGTNYGWAASLPNFSGVCRARIKHTSGALNGQTGDYYVGALMQAPFGSPQHYRAGGFAIKALDTVEKNYLALPANGVTVEVRLFIDFTISKDRPLLIDDVDPIALLQDLCDGKFGYLWRAGETSKPSDKSFGDPKRVVPTNGMRYPVTAAMLSQSGLTAFTAANVVDGKHDTNAWHTDSAVSGAWLKADLGTAKAITFLRVFQSLSSGAYKGIYDVEYSDNDSSWTKAYVGLTFKSAAGGDVHEGWNEAGWGNAGAHRYWRLLLTNTPGSGPWLNELELFEGPAGTRPKFRGLIKSREHLIDWVEETLLVQYHLTLYLDKSGRINVVDLRLPNTLSGIPTLVDDDTVAGGEFNWEHDATAAVTRMEFTRYFDRVTLAADLLSNSELYPELPGGGLIEEFGHPLVVLDIGSSDFGDEPMEVDAVGFRAMAGETVENISRLQYMEDKLIELGAHMRRPFGYGLTTINIACRRTATVNGLAQGSLVLLAVSQVPDPASYQRGGTRLCRVLEISEDGPVANIELVDLAVNVVSQAPSLAQPAVVSGSAYTATQAALTLNASSQPAEVAIAVTPTSVGTAPANDNDRAWVTVGVFRTAQTIAVDGLAPGFRVWWRCRTLPDHVAEPQVPSPWALAGGNGRADTTALPSVSSLTATGVTQKAALLGWTNSANDLQIYITLATPAGVPGRGVGILPLASTQYQLNNLLASTSYRAGVGYRLGQYRGPETTVDFTTSGTPPTAPAVAGFSIMTK